MKKILLKLFIVLAVASSNFKVHAQLVSWSFNSVSATPVVNSSDVTASSLALSSGTIQYTATPSSIFASSWSTSATFNSTGKYWEFSIAPTSGKQLLITSISFQSGRTSTGPADIKAQYSLNGFSTLGIDAGDFNNSNTDNLTTFSLSNLPSTSFTNSFTVRLWGFNASSTGNFRINNIQIQGATSTLPIQLSSFTAQAIDKTILLNWETVSETNNSSFEIERSIDGKSFTKIGSKEGSGTTTALTKYRFVDENPLPGTNYYRLKQIDFDGKSEISAVRSATSSIPFATLSVLQSASAVTAQVISPVKEKAKLSLFDISGKVLAQQDVFLERGLNQFDFSQNLVSGIYFFKLTSASNQVNTKFVKP